MAKKIERVGVLGAGLMGRAIAAHCANAGIPSLLLDIVPPKASEEERQSRTVRNSFAAGGLQKAIKSRPAEFFHKDLARYVEIGNFDDDAARLGECDLIVEAVVERLDIKRKVFAMVDEHRKPGTLVASNTSGLRLEDLIEGRSPDFKKSFLITHFFNPVRYMKLLEIVPGKATSKEAVEAAIHWGQDVLGKGIVLCKDTPSFVANRIGVHGIMNTFAVMEQGGYTIEEVDAVAGPPMARPKTAVFKLGDLVGLDTLVHVANNVVESCPDDETVDLFKVPAWVQKMVDEGALGRKSGKGFYTRTKTKEVLVRDPKTGEYGPRTKPRFDSVKTAKGIDDPAQRFKALVNADDRGGELAWKLAAPSLAYAVNRMGEITDDIVAVDNAMKWGFAWDLGPFESWDALGVRETVKRMTDDGMEVPKRVVEMLEKGNDAFYKDGKAYDILNQRYVDNPIPANVLILSDTEKYPVVEKNDSASLRDLGDGILGVEFHTKANVIDDKIIEFMHKAIDMGESNDWQGVVFANEGEHFSAGANLFLVAMYAMQKEFEPIEKMIDALQQATQRMRYSDVPVVAAPFGMALAGGCEVMLGADAVQASAELYTGFVEVGVGVIPAAGGCKEHLFRSLETIPAGAQVDPLAIVGQVFQHIALAKVSTSALEAQKMGLLRPTDGIIFDKAQVIHSAKQLALGMARAGYRKPHPRAFKLPGESGMATLDMMLFSFKMAGQASEHDVKIGRKLANILCGGKSGASHLVTEQDILDLEREAFLSLLGEEKTVERMQHMVMNNKPLRN